MAARITMLKRDARVAMRGNTVVTAVKSGCNTAQLSEPACSI